MFPLKLAIFLVNARTLQMGAITAWSGTVPPTTMNHHTSRRHFLKTAMSLPVAMTVGPTLFAQSSPPAAAAPTGGVLPMRKLGRNGPDVTLISLGGMMGALSPDYLDIAWSMGIRYFDTADCYLKGRSEKIIGEWLAKYPERRKELFLVSKDHPRNGPGELLEMIDRRLAACGTDYLDLFFIHGLGPKEYGENAVNWPKSDAFKSVCEKLKSSGKARMVGFSCHDGTLVQCLNSAAEGGFVDGIMLKYTPFFTPGDDFDRAVSACHKVGIGLVAMKTMRSAGEVPARIPEFDKLGLTTHQGLLQAVYSDERISAVCSAINNVGEMEANTAAARDFKGPLKFADIAALKATVLANRRTMCPGCPSCDAASAATKFAFLDISRYVSYYEMDGDLHARELFHALPADRRNHGSLDLAALRDGCSFGTDYPEIIRRANSYFV
jgi:aryl-alcohol dehydrogenase-like predicted oxidoreductase